MLLALAFSWRADAQRLAYSTYLGGANSDIIHALAVDNAGFVYVTGETLSADFPVTPGALQTKHGGVPQNVFFIGDEAKTDAFVAKLAPGGGALIWSTFLGGSKRDVGTAIALDADGSVYVAGTTDSADFPTTPSAFQRTGTPNLPHGFVAKINASGTALAFSTLVGGSGMDLITALTIDPDGNPYVTGYTSSQDFPTSPGAWQRAPVAPPSPFGVVSSGFVTKLNSTGTALEYSTFLAGSQGSTPSGIALDRFRDAVVVGTTNSADFPVTPGSYQDHPAAPQQAFASKVLFTGTALIWSTFLGRDKASASAVAVNADGSVFIGGSLSSSSQPDAFVMRFSEQGLYGYSTVVSGQNGATIDAIAADNAGNVYAAGVTRSRDLPVTADAITGSFADAPCVSVTHTPFTDSRTISNCGDAFVLRLNSETTRTFSTYFAGNDRDEATAIAVDSAGSIYIAGSSRSANLPATGFQQRAKGGTCVFQASPSANSATTCEDGFVAKFAAPGSAVDFTVLNGASRLPGPVSPGEIVRFLPPSFSSRYNPVQLAVNGGPVPLLKDEDAELVASLPASLAGLDSIAVNLNAGLEFPGTLHFVGNARIQVAAAVPGIFTVGRSGVGQAASAAAGSEVGIFVTGVDNNPSIYVGGKIATITFAGQAPGEPAGVTQINFRVPALDPGPQPLFVACGNLVTSQAGVLLTVVR